MPASAAVRGVRRFALESITTPLRRDDGYDRRREEEEEDSSLAERVTRLLLLELALQWVGLVGQEAKKAVPASSSGATPAATSFDAPSPPSAAATLGTDPLAGLLAHHVHLTSLRQRLHTLRAGMRSCGDGSGTSSVMASVLRYGWSGERLVMGSSTTPSSSKPSGGSSDTPGVSVAGSTQDEGETAPPPPSEAKIAADISQRWAKEWLERLGVPHAPPPPCDTTTQTMSPPPKRAPRSTTTLSPNDGSSSSNTSDEQQLHLAITVPLHIFDSVAATLTVALLNSQRRGQLMAELRSAGVAEAKLGDELTRGFEWYDVTAAAEGLDANGDDEPLKRKDGKKQSHHPPAAAAPLPFFSMEWVAEELVYVVLSWDLLFCDLNEYGGGDDGFSSDSLLPFHSCPEHSPSGSGGGDAPPLLHYTSLPSAEVVTAILSSVALPALLWRLLSSTVLPSVLPVICSTGALLMAMQLPPSLLCRGGGALSSSAVGLGDGWWAAASMSAGVDDGEGGMRSETFEEVEARSIAARKGDWMRRQEQQEEEETAAEDDEATSPTTAASRVCREARQSGGWRRGCCCPPVMGLVHYSPTRPGSAPSSASQLQFIRLQDDDDESAGDDSTHQQHPTRPALPSCYARLLAYPLHEVVGTYLRALLPQHVKEEGFASESGVRGCAEDRLEAWLQLLVTADSSSDSCSSIYHLGRGLASSTSTRFPAKERPQGRKRRREDGVCEQTGEDDVRELEMKLPAKRDRREAWLRLVPWKDCLGSSPETASAGMTPAKRDSGGAECHPDANLLEGHHASITLPFDEFDDGVSASPSVLPSLASLQTSQAASAPTGAEQQSYHLVVMPDAGGKHEASGQDATFQREEQQRLTEEAWGEVCGVLSAVSSVLSARTLVDDSAWRYTRNHISLAASSYVGLLMDEEGGSNEDAKETSGNMTDDRTVPNNLKAAVPASASVSVAASPSSCREQTVPPPLLPSSLGGTGDMKKETMACHAVLLHEPEILYTEEGKTFALEKWMRHTK